MDIADKYRVTVLNGGSAIYFTGVTICSPLDISLVSSSFADETSWFADIETHGSDHVPTFITISRFYSGKVCTNLFYTSWEIFQEKMRTALRDITSAEYFLFILAFTKYEATKSSKMANSQTAVNSEYERLSAIRRRAECRTRKNGDF